MLKYYRLPEVLERCGIGRSTVYRKMEDGEFPLPRQLTAQSVGWRSDEVEEWINSRPVAAVKRPEPDPGVPVTAGSDR